MLVAVAAGLARLAAGNVLSTSGRHDRVMQHIRFCQSAA